MLSETHITNEIEECEVTIKGYKLMQCYSHSRHTGGVAVYIRNKIKCSVLNSVSIKNNVWILSIDVKFEAKPLICTVLYHSPSASDSYFLKEFENWIKDNINYDKCNVLAGDFNINIMKKSTYGERLKNILNLYGLKQTVSDPTRITNTSATLIDLVITNQFELNSTVLLAPQISDHSIIKINVHSDSVSEKDIISVKSYKNYSKSELNKKLSEMEWNEWNNQSFDYKSQNLIDRLKQCVSELITYKNINLKSKNDWFSDELKELKRKKEELFKHFRVSDCPTIWTKYKSARNEYVKQLEINKNNLLKKKIEKCGTEQKQMWKLLKQEILPNQKKSGAAVEYIMFHDDKETSASKICERFNDYFIDSIEEINKSIVEVAKNHNNIVTEVKNNNLIFKEVNIIKLKQVLNSINKKK